MYTSIYFYVRRAEFGARSALRNRVTSSDLSFRPIRMLHKPLYSWHSGLSFERFFNFIKFHQKTDRSRSNCTCPTPKFVRHFESRRRALIIEYLPCCQWSERPPWFFDAPEDPLFRSSDKPRGTLWHANDPWLQEYHHYIPKTTAKHRRRRRGTVEHGPPSQNWVKIFSRQLSCKIRAFC